MCVVSMIGDHFNDEWKRRYPGIEKQDWWKNIPTPVNPEKTPGIPQDFINNLPITRREFEELKKEVELVKQLLVKSMKYDEEHNQPHCEMEEKVELIKKIAELVGVDMKEVFGNE